MLEEEPEGGSDAAVIKKPTSPQAPPTPDYYSVEAIRIRVNGKWLELSKEFVASHPGGSVINQYRYSGAVIECLVSVSEVMRLRDAEATHIFHAFHEGSSSAYKQLTLLERNAQSTHIPDDPYPSKPESNGTTTHHGPSDNVATYDFSVEEEMRIVKNFESLRQEVHRLGMMEERPYFYVRKVAEVTTMFTAVLALQYYGWWLASAMVLALCWQQLGWLTHEFCHVGKVEEKRLIDVCNLK